MDSMRSLNRSLPASTPAQPPPEQLLRAFRQAALSVTNLYKSAASDQDSARRAGYQDALDDLLKFLDREDLGLQDGEGWKVREWVTARYDAASATNQHSESEDDVNDTDQRQPSVSPAPVDIAQPTQSQTPAISEIQPSSTTTAASPITVSPATPSIEQPPVFEFTANSDIHMHSDDFPKTYPTDHTQPRMDTLKSNRALSKQSGRPSRSVRATGQAAGSKRKLPFPDISELFNVGFDRKDVSDGGSGSKRSKHSL